MLRLLSSSTEKQQISSRSRSAVHFFRHIYAVSLCQLKCIQRERRKGHGKNHHLFSPCLCARHCAKFVAQTGKNLPAVQETWGSITGSGRSPGEGNGTPLQYCCPEKSHGQRNLAGYSPWGRKDLDTTERLTLSHYAHVSIKMHSIPRESRKGRENNHHLFSPCLCARHCAECFRSMTSLILFVKAV